MYIELERLKYYSRTVSSYFVFIVALLAYWITVDPSASYWDCPEYVTVASRLEIGHPPGNPVWALAMRVATIPFGPSRHALVINLCSGLFMALAAMFLSRIIFNLVEYSLRHMLSFCEKYVPESAMFIPTTASVAGGLCFALCDSAWFSAVEAEVYAMSAFLTSFVIWMMLKWADTADVGKRQRYLVLICYLTGLSLGVHQLNLLCIPVLALIYLFNKNRERCSIKKVCSATLISFLMIAAILIGMMHGTLDWAQKFELFAVNHLHLPYFSGVFIYLAVLFTAIVASAVAIQSGTRISVFISLTFFFWMSGFLAFGGNIWIAILLSAILSFILLWLRKLSDPELSTFLWGGAFIILGYSSFALILIRGYAAPPMNEAPPTDIFSLSSYIARDQYGSKPLLYGATPYSKPLLEERWAKGNPFPDYSRYILRQEKPKYIPTSPDARLSYRSNMLSAEDSARNISTLSEKRGYILSDYSFSRETTPELDMFFPRITGSSPSDLESYESWVGMNKETMDRVVISETIDSLGNPAGKIGIGGSRGENFSFRPTYMQHLNFMLSYQIGYMYFRYLLWNFMGRQNDIPSSGEIDHGNFITGFRAIDNAMLGDQSLMPASASEENKGRNVYYGIPFLLGILGIIFMSVYGKSSRRALSIVVIMFLMTGIAIVVYLNQTPGEPRERDYSFLGSYMAFAIWIGFGISAIWVWLQKFIWEENLINLITAIIAAVPVILLGYENFDDHDRSGRDHPYEFASYLLSNNTPAIIFSQGDNFTFPLWYAQEVRGTGSRHTVIDASYFATPEYVVNLMKQGENGIKLTASPSDIAYGAYAYSRIAQDADTVPVEAIDALKELYAQSDGNPVIRHRFMRIPIRNSNDTITIDLKKLSNGSNLLPFKQLMLLDLMATNAASASPKQVYFHSAVSSDFYNAFRPWLIRLPYAQVLNAAQTHCRQPDLIMDALQKPMSDFLKPKPYVAYRDPVIDDQVRRQRGEMIIAARIMMENGRMADASQIAYHIGWLHPYEYVSAGSFTLADTTFHEGLEYASLLVDISRQGADRFLARKASSAVNEMLRESKKWRQYYASLPKWRRATVSNSTLRFISIIPRLEILDSISKNNILTVDNEAAKRTSMFDIIDSDDFIMHRRR